MDGSGLRSCPIPQLVAMLNLRVLIIFFLEMTNLLKVNIGEWEIHGKEDFFVKICNVK